MERRCLDRPPRWTAAAALLAVTAVLCAWAAPAAAREPDTFGRFYYSSWMTGRVPHSPADPTGAYNAGEPLAQNPRTELEVIFLRRLGLSYSRQKLQRAFDGAPADVPGCLVAGCKVNEESVEQSFNLTLYGRQVAHDSFNLFLGGGSGYLNYKYTVDGVEQTQGDLYHGMALSRWFWGFEYTFQRMGFRVDFSRMTASKSLPGQRAELAENRTQLSFIIPLN